MSEKAKKILKFSLIGIAALVVVAVIGAGLYWNHMLNLLGDADETVPTLSYEEEMALLGETVATEPTETTVPEETTVPVETTVPEETTVPADTTAPEETTAPVETTTATQTGTPA